MTPLHSILVATDFSVDGDNAVRRAALLAHEHGARLKLVHLLAARPFGPLRGWFAPATDTDLEAAQARARLRRTAVELAGRHDLSASIEVLVGEPRAALLQASESADLLVLGRPLDRWLRACRAPVLVVKAPAQAPYRRVLLPMDLEAPSDDTLEMAARLARHGDLHVFHAINSHRDAVLRDIDLPEYLIREARARQEAGAIARMRRKAARVGLDGARMAFAVAQGHPLWATLNHARGLGADLIVAGRPDRSSLVEILLGSVSRRLLDEAGADVLVITRRAPDRAGAAAAAAPRSAAR